MVKLISAEFDKGLKIPLFGQIKAGFPSPADDYMRESLDFNRDLIKHPEATFYGRVDGDSMEGDGIYDGDIAVIDRSLDAIHDDIVVVFVNGEFTMKRLDLSHRSEGIIYLRPSNPKYRPIVINATDEFRVWGVVIWTIHNWRR